MALNLAPFGRWTLRDKAAQRRLALRCACCGFVKEKLPLDVRSWECPECGTAHDRDVNAVRKILAAGLAVLAFGDNVSDNDILVSLSSCR